ncbi:MAG: iron-containing alcohol dehydrogenase, partial [Anaerolineae bacterium]|nr:iron-containing alcohol dehydrogenase [Anaerolineae bacterium]
LLLPYVMQHNLPACPQAFAEVARRLGEKVEGLSALEAGGRSVQAVQQLKADIGIPMRLRDVGVSEADIPEMARVAVGVRRLLALNPRPLSQQDMEALLQTAY